MIPIARKALLLVLAALPSVSIAASKFTWFDDSSEPGAIRARPSAFDADLYRSLSTPADSAEPEHRISVYGDYAPRASATLDSARPFANFGVRWQHRVSSQDQLAVSAQQADSMLPYATTVATAETLDTRATISWTRELSWSWRPSVTGGVFVGDESARDEAVRQASRRYFGFSVGGEMKLLQAHTPYVSFRMERSLYDLPEASAVGAGGSGTSAAYARTIDDSSRVAAGWRWQVQRGWSVQAEASYGFAFDNHTSETLFQDRERSRVFFGTRFDFR
jgi:hypothetical protein